MPESDEVDDERYTMWRSLVLSTAPSGPFPYYDCDDDDDDDDWFVEVSDDEYNEEDEPTAISPVHLPVGIPIIVITPPEEELPKEEGNRLTFGESAEKLSTSSDVSFITFVYGRHTKVKYMYRHIFSFLMDLVPGGRREVEGGGRGGTEYLWRGRYRIVDSNRHQ